MIDVVRESVPIRKVSQYALSNIYRASGWRYPRWYQSPTALFAGGAAFRMLDMNGTQTILKHRTIYTTTTTYAILPPVSPIGDIAAERRAVWDLRGMGVAVYMTDDDAWRLGIKDAHPIPGAIEYIYRVGDMAALKGKQWANERSQVHQAERRGLVAGTYRPPPKPDIAEPRQTEEKSFTKTDRLAQRPALSFAYHMPERNTPE